MDTFCADTETFIARWRGERISELAHAQTFVIQLCALLGVTAPDAERLDHDYSFEKVVRFLDDERHPVGRIDCYRRDCFVLESKKGGVGGPGSATHDALMRKAKRQAENYAKALDEWPPFLIVVDIGRSIELWADFARQGKAYVPFPDRSRQRIELEQLRDPAIRALLATVWTDPMSLDPAARRAEVTTDIAARLAWLARSIGARVPVGPDGRAPDAVERAARASKTALFMTQCIFAMFADSVGLIEDRAFLNQLLKDYRGKAQNFHLAASGFFRTLDTGGHCAAVRQDLKQFNGGLFRIVAPVQITEEELEALIAAAELDWAMVEPAIFGALLEQALDPAERSELGAHYTPRAFVERLVGPVVIEPLRARWEAIELTAMDHFDNGRRGEARRLIRNFHRELCQLTVLDPACGTGNFLYVAMSMLKELESEVLGLLHEVDGQGLLEMPGLTVSPAQFQGIEKNDYAARIAQMVLWIGQLQWHFRVHGAVKPTEPILKDEGSIECRDAILACDRIEIAPGTTADGREQARYVNPRPAPWPAADYIVGNPPFMGAKDMRRELGDGYVEALWAIRQGRFRSADLVTIWWDRAAEALTAKASPLRRFGFITTNSITQTFSRRVIESWLAGPLPVRLTYAVPDHPWVKGAGRAAVRIAMSVAERVGASDTPARSARVISEEALDTETPVVLLAEKSGEIGADLKTAVAPTASLRANAGLCSRGVQLMGSGFAINPHQAAALLEESAGVIRPYRNGRDIAERPRGLMAIDLFGLSEAEVRRNHPHVFEHLLATVKSERDRNNRASYRQNWWLFGEPRREMRQALEGLPRYIVTVETAKHRWFRFLDASILPDNKLVVVASDSAAHLGVLSSRAHRAWFVAHSGRIGVYDGDAVYVKSACFDAFPFPEMTDAETAEIGEWAMELEQTRDRAIMTIPGMTMTRLYNLCQAIEGGEPMSEADRRDAETACIRLIGLLHQRIDQKVEAAYGWADRPGDVVLVERLAALNLARRTEEERGLIRHLRPAFQQARGPSVRPAQTEVDFRPERQRPALPESPEGLAQAVLSRARSVNRPIGAAWLAEGFVVRQRSRAEARIEQTLAILAVTGSVQKTDAGWFAPRAH